MNSRILSIINAPEYLNPKMSIGKTTCTTYFKFGINGANIKQQTSMLSFGSKKGLKESSFFFKRFSFAHIPNQWLNQS